MNDFAPFEWTDVRLIVYLISSGHLGLKFGDCQRSESCHHRQQVSIIKSTAALLSTFQRTAKILPPNNLLPAQKILQQEKQKIENLTYFYLDKSERQCDQKF